MGLSLDPESRIETGVENEVIVTQAHSDGII